MSGSYARRRSVSSRSAVGNLREDLVGALFLEVVEDVGALVRRHLRDEGGGLACREPLEDFAAELLVEVLEDVGGALLRQCAKEVRYSFSRKGFGNVGEIGRVHLLRFCRYARRILVEEIENVRSKQRGYSPYFMFARRRMQGSVPRLFHHTTGSVRRSSRNSATS